MENDVARARYWFAEDLRVAAGITTDAIIAAFACVPRETFVGAPPWRVGTRIMQEYQTFEGNPAVLYHDVVVALDEEREINNGGPGLWARLFQEAQPQAGDRVLHLGCGTGYYTAILAELVGSNGFVHGVEVEPQLAKRAKDALASWPNVTVTCSEGVRISPESWDLIIVSAGATHPLGSWLAGLKPNGRLLFPLTANTPNPRSGTGALLLVSRCGDRAFAARFLSPASFVHFAGGRDSEANMRLLQVIRQGFAKITDVHSLRQDQHDEDDTCWLHADTFCISYRYP
jgi:protein-L-isoaspartate(D-aspartate) O-methyltransferase